jgi:hypothetical protein
VVVSAPCNGLACRTPDCPECHYPDNPAGWKLAEAWEKADYLYEEHRKAVHVWSVAVERKEEARVAHRDAALIAGALGPRPAKVTP